MSNERLILETFQTAMRTGAIPASSVPTLPVKYVGVAPWKIPDDQKWLEIVWIPSNNNDDFWGSEKNYRGAIRFVLHWPNTGGGAYSPLDVLDSITAYFTKGLTIAPVQIVQPPDFEGVLDMGHEILYPVTLRYQCFRTA